jgi:hypothetical protein
MHFLGFGQEIINVNSIYQKILNDEKFMNEIEKDTAFQCKSNYLYVPTKNDSVLNLTFRGKSIIKYEAGEWETCPVFKFKSFKKGRNSLSCIAVLEKVICSSKEGLLYRLINYSCLVVYKKGLYQFKNIQIGYNYRTVDFR